MNRQELTHANAHDAHANAANKVTRKVTHFTVIGIAAGQKVTLKFTQFTVTQSTNSRQMFTVKFTRFTISTKAQVKKSRESHAASSRTPLSKEREGGPTASKRHRPPTGRSPPHKRSPHRPRARTRLQPATRDHTNDQHRATQPNNSPNQRRSPVTTTPTTEPTRGLTIKQPWAFAIAEGFKTIENRSRRTNYRGTLLIHAGRGVDDSVSIVRHSRDAAIRLDELGGRSNFWDARTYLPSSIAPPPPTSLALCAVIATARLADCHEAADGCCPPWGLPGQWHWELADIRPLDRAVAKSGALGFWKPDAVLLDAMRRACGKCRKPFDPTDPKFDGRARHRDTPYCRSCVDRCHSTEIADHRCVICA